MLSADIAHNYRPTRSGIDGLVLEHFSRTGQHQKCFELLYPREDTPDYYIYENFQSVADQVNALGELDNIHKEIEHDPQELIDEINQDVRDFLDPNETIDL